MEPEVVSVAEARAMTRLGDTKIREMIKTCELASVKIGRRRLVRVESIRRLTRATQIAA
ncbi:MAG TPA: helix-turn-helix domain-containing protein [Sphingobium sp.]